jgi:hypothetical protein
VGVLADDDLAPFVTPGTVVLVGEVHGTHELPAVAGRLARIAAAQGRPVAVALEVPRTEQPALDAFLAGPDDAAARAALTASAFWHPLPGWDDGRAGRGLLRLVRSLHALAADGTDVAVTAMDLPRLASGTPVPPDVVALLVHHRDEVMADAAAAALAPVVAAGGLGVVLAGNVHTRVRRRVPFGPAPVGVHLARRFDVVALEGHFSGGTCRVMLDASGAQTVRFAPQPTPPGSAGRYRTRREARRRGHHGWVNVGVLTPSSPLPPRSAAPSDA